MNLRELAKAKSLTFSASKTQVFVDRIRGFFVGLSLLLGDNEDGQIGALARLFQPFLLGFGSALRAGFFSSPVAPTM